jgi:hypothetical protein
MPCKGKSKRKHTPITSQKEQGLFGADLRRKRAGEKTVTGMSEADLVSHLEESKGRDLPLKALATKKRTCGRR